MNILLLLSLAIVSFSTFSVSLPASNLGTICITKADCTELLTCNKNVCSILEQIVSEYLYQPTDTTTTPTTTPTTTTTPTITPSTSSGELDSSCVSDNDCNGVLVCKLNVCSNDKLSVSRPIDNCMQSVTKNVTQGTTVIDNVYVSVYGFDDNDDGSGNFGVSTISNPVIHKTATESTGAYDSPSTFASDSLFRVFNVGEIIYIPKFRKYYILEDTCVECTSDQTMGNIHIDIYIGGNTKLEGPTLLNCEDSLDTGGFNTVIIRNPTNDLPVNTVVFYSESSQTCNPTTFNS